MDDQISADLGDEVSISQTLLENINRWESGTPSGNRKFPNITQIISAGRNN